MAAKQIDAVSSFQHVVDNCPQWESQLSELAVYAAGKYDEFVSEYKKVMHQVKQKRQKSNSIASIQSEAVSPGEDLKSPQLSDFVEIDPMEAGNRYLYAQAQKKRRAGTSLRSNASGVRNVRSRKNVIVYYDSHIQSELDKLVRAFGAARNNLRKGKNAYTVSRGFSLPSLSRRYDITNRMTTAGGKLQPTKTQSDTALTTTSTPSVDTSFVTVDKDLEAIQSLCESAAHQAIRDGDCSAELNEALAKLEAVLSSVVPILDLVKMEMDSIASESRPEGSTSSNISTQSTLYEKTSTDAFEKTESSDIISSDALKRPVLATFASAPQPLAVDTIEVDDDEDDDGSSLDLPMDFANYRTVSRRIAT